MVEVFKTNVEDPFHAQELLALIHSRFDHYRANFDLEDCDRILRVQSAGAPISNTSLITLLNDRGFWAELL